jgi:hypothetical protein
VKPQGRLHRLWFWWGEAYVTIAGREFGPPLSAWRAYCWARRRHDVINDHCGKPEHRYCWICRTTTPGAEVTA